MLYKMLYLLKLTKTTGILVNTLINFNQQKSKNPFCALPNVVFPHTMFLEKTFNIIIYNIESDLPYKHRDRRRSLDTGWLVASRQSPLAPANWHAC